MPKSSTRRYNKHGSCTYKYMYIRQALAGVLNLVAISVQNLIGLQEDYACGSEIMGRANS